MKNQNKNDIPLTKNDLNGILKFSNFEFKKYFEKLCEIVPDVDNEKVFISNENEKINKSELIYAFVYNGELLKIGSTTTSFKKRIQSYNCGKKIYRKSGTCSTTNYFVLQTFLNINEKIDVYVFFPPSFKIDDDFLGKIEISVPAKKYENKILDRMKKNGVFPVLCTQR